MVDIGLPSKSARKELFKLNLKDIKIEPSIDWDQLATKTQGYSGADIANVCREAAMLPMRKKLKEKIDLTELVKLQGEFERPIGMSDLCTALKTITRTVVSQYLDKYGSWVKQFGSS